jgi:fluoride ion exporter CrcB/FEX
MRILAKWRKLLPHGWGDWLMVCGSLSFIVWILVRHFVPIDVLDPSTFDSPAWRIGNGVGIGGMVVAASTSIVDGIRSMRRGGVSWKAAATAVVGVLVCLSFAVGGLVLSRAARDFANLLDELKERPSLATLDRALDRPDLPPEKRAFLSKLYAAERYRKDGVLVDYIMPEGKSVQYQPSAQDIILRRLETVAPTLLTNSASHLRMAPAIWIGVALSSVALGVFSPVRTARGNKSGVPPPNPPFQPAG